METARSQATAAVILGRLATLWFGVLVGFLALGSLKRRLGRLEFDDPSASPAGAEATPKEAPTADAR